MPRIWVSCRPELLVRGREPRGFTLLELLLVLALLAMLIGLVAPAGQRALDGASERAQFRRVEDVLRGLPYEAFRQGRPMRIDAAALRERLPELPPAWQIEMEQPLVYSPSGVSSGGEIVLKQSGGLVHRWRVSPVTGELRPG